MGTAAGSSSRRALVVGCASAAFAVAGLALAPLNRRVPEAALSYYAVPDFVGAVLFSVLGGWLVTRRGDNLVSWLLFVVGIGGALSFFSTQYAALALVARTDLHLPLGDLAGGAAELAFIVPNVATRTLLLYAFPETRLNTRTGRLVSLGCLAGAGAVALSVLGLHTPSFGPLAVPPLAGFARWAQRWVELGLGVVTAACVGLLLARTRRAGPPLRSALVCFDVGAVAVLIAFSVPPFVRLFDADYDPSVWLGPVLLTAALVLLAGGTALAVLRYRVWEIDVVLRRSLLLASMSLCLAAAYLGVVALADALLGARRLPSALGAALVIGGIAAPLRSWLQHRLDRLFYGARAAPDAAVAQLGRRVGDVADRHAVLPEIAGAIADSLRVPYVALDIVDDDGLRLTAEWGHDRFGRERVELNAQGETVGHLEVGRREPGRALDPRDLRLLKDLSRHAALAALALRRSYELQQSRQRLVGTREEERRRLRRDLHDGLGPALAATTLQLDEAAGLVRKDPHAAETLLQTLRIRTQDLIVDVRRLVHELRPPALDELGLVGAIRQQAANLSAATVFEVVAGSEEPALPAAVEVALWRIAGEAMTNVSRHAGARRCQVRVTVSPGRAELDVRDDGCGLKGATPGVGMSSVRERAAELGGVVSTETSSEGGTVLRAVIPLAELQR